MVCGFSAGVTVGTTAGLTTGDIMGRTTPGTPGIGGRDTIGGTPIAPGRRIGNVGRTIAGYGDG